MYQQIAWQTVQTAATNDGDSSPATGIENTITGEIGGQPQPYPTKERDDVPGTYQREMAPFELTSASVTLDWLTTSPAVTLNPATVVMSLTDPATLSTETQYCTVLQLYQYFGSENVNKWADKNDYRIIDEIAQAIIDAIVNVSSRVNALMRDKYYDVPFSPIPYEIMHTTRLMAGYELHAARGIEDSDSTIEAAAKEANLIIKQILAGQILFDLPTNQRAV